MRARLPVHAAEVLTAHARRAYDPLAQIRAVMAIRGVTQTALARELGIERTLVHKVLSGKTRGGRSFAKVQRWAFGSKP